MFFLKIKIVELFKQCVVTECLNLKRYANYIFYRLIKLLLPLIKLWGRRQIAKYGSQPLKYQPIFIIGAPRTGSTILYQSLTNQFDVLYINNLVCGFYNSLIFGFFLSGKLFKQQAHNCFASDYGSTLGLNSPSECGEFWYRWLPRHKHFIDHDEVDARTVEKIRQEITAIINKYDKPLVFKNLNAGQRLRLLYKCFPEAKFIFCKRKPFFTAQSILNAKRKLGLVDNEFWSVMPRNVEELKKLPWAEQIVGQIYYLEKQISEDLALFPKENVVEVYYELLSNDTLQAIADQFALSQRPEFAPEKIELREKKNLLDAECAKIEAQIGNYFNG